MAAAVGDGAATAAAATAAAVEQRAAPAPEVEAAKAIGVADVLAQRPGFISALSDDVLLDEPEDHEDVVANLAEALPPMPDIFNRGDSVYLLLPPKFGGDTAYQDEQWDTISNWLYADEPKGASVWKWGEEGCRRERVFFILNRAAGL